MCYVNYKLKKKIFFFFDVQNIFQRHKNEICDNVEKENIKKEEERIKLNKIKINRWQKRDSSTKEETKMLWATFPLK